MFYRDQREFKTEMIALIDHTSTTISRDGSNNYLATFRRSAHVLFERHKIYINRKEFVRHLSTLIMAHNFVRAKKLVNALGDQSLTRFGSISILLFVATLGLGALGLFVWFVVWLATA